MKLFLMFILTLGFAMPSFAQSNRRGHTVAPQRGEDGIAESREYQLYTDLDSLARWCNSVIWELDTAERRAEALESRGKMAEAFQALKDGLVRANTGGREVTGLMTKKALIRGIRNLTALAREVGGTERGVRTAIYYSAKYYAFVKDVAENLDIPYIVPRERCGRCQMNNEEQFEKQFIRFVGESLSVGTDALVFERGGQIFPVGSSRALLTVMKSASQDAANDLDDSLFRYFYSCTISELTQISCDIDVNNPDDVFEINNAWGPIKNISRELLESGRCSDGRRPRRY